MPETEAESHQHEEEEHHAEELAEWRPVSSSMVAEVSYAEGELYVNFISGSEASYPCSELEFEELLHAPSVGKWMWQTFGNELHRGRTEE